MSVVGIDDIALHFPRLYFAMQDFAEFRGADYGKLSKGLGLEAMAIPDVHEDTATRTLERRSHKHIGSIRMYTKV